MLLVKQNRCQTDNSFSFSICVWFIFRFHEHWRFVLQRLVFLSAFVVYLEGETLVTREEVAQILGSRYQFVCCVLPTTTYVAQLDSASPYLHLFFTRYVFITAQRRPDSLALIIRREALRFSLVFVLNHELLSSLCS